MKFYSFFIIIFIFLLPYSAQSITDPTYTIQKGDTLSGISKKLFGSGDWRELWVINNSKITNPHKIYPGTLIAYASGSNTSFPSIQVSSNPNSPTQPKSDEWKFFPKQRWERTPPPLSPEIDPLGFDNRNVILKPKLKGYETIAIPASNEIPLFGNISGAQTLSRGLGLNDIVYFKSSENQNIQVKETYAITNTPFQLKSKKSNREGYSYLFKGSVFVEGVQDGVYYGTITSAKDVIERGDSLIKMPLRIPELTPIAATSEISGIVMIDHRNSTFSSAQNKEVFIDRGSKDGVQVGMVFRAFQTVDPTNEKKITESNFIILADMIVNQVTKDFCSAMILQTRNLVVDDTPVFLLTDISDIQKNLGISKHSPRILNPSSSPYPLQNKDENLDDLDSKESLGNKEKQELEQLKQWKQNPSSSPDLLPLPPPSSSAPPSSSLAPSGFDSTNSLSSPPQPSLHPLSPLPNSAPPENALLPPPSSSDPFPGALPQSNSPSLTPPNFLPEPPELPNTDHLINGDAPPPPGFEETEEASSD